MKKNLKIFKYVLFAPFIFAAACSNPKTIPDSKLSDIFKDMYLANAYADEYGRNLTIDSINIYEPILNEYGYTTRDFTYTLANFTKRKSAKIAPVITEANNKLDRMLADAESKIARENTIDSLARESAREVVYFAESIHVTEKADTGRLRIVIPTKEGLYKISHSTLQDSMDTNTGLINRYYLRDKARKVLVMRQSSVTRGIALENFSVEIEATPRAAEVEIILGDYKKGLSKPDLRVDSLEVVWYPTAERARKIYVRQWLYKGVATDTMEYDWFGKEDKEDSGAFRILSREAPAEADTVSVGRRSDTRGLAIPGSRRDSMRGVLQRPIGSRAD